MSQYTQPQEPAYSQGPLPGSHGRSPETARNGLGTAALILGLIGAISGVIPFLFWMAGILGLIALILGLSGRGRAKRGGASNKGVATAGALLGLVALILSVVGMVITFKAVGDAVDEIDKATSPGLSAPKKAGGGDDAKDKALAADESATYDDVSFTVSAAKPYKTAEGAIGHAEGNKAYEVTLVIKNTGKKKFDATLVTAQARAGADGVAAEQIFDGTAEGMFTGAIMPGKKASVRFAFDAPADAKNLTVEVTPGLLNGSAQWDLKL